MPQFTRKAIMASFVRLLEKKPFDKITVRDIVEDCGVNRNTFYYYYQDSFALLEELMSTLSERLSASDTDAPWQEGFSRLVDFALEHKKQIYHVYESNRREQLMARFSRFIGKLLYISVRQQAKGLRIAESELHFAADFCRYAVVGVMDEWLRGGMDEDTERIIMRLGQLMDGSVRSMLEVLSKDGEKP